MDNDNTSTEAIPALASNGVESASTGGLEDQIRELVDELYDPLLRYLTLLSWDPGASEEIAQEAFLRLHQEILQGARIGSAKNWLFRVAHNLAIDRARSSKPEHSLSDEDVSRRVEQQFGRVLPDPESLLLERERMRRLHRAVNALPTQQRHALYLRREGFRYREIAAILGMGETTVIDHVRRAVERLNQELHDSRSL
jgi:RNA polymerase sigma-70 factor (ECF subfamily)